MDAVLNLSLEGADVDRDAYASLKDFILDAKIDQLSSVAEDEESVSKEKLGGGFIVGLGVVLGSAAVVELVKTVHTWIRARRLEVSVDIQLKDGETITIRSANPPDVETVVAQANVLAKSIQGQ